MTKTVRVEFSEQSKSVVASVSIQYEGQPDISNDQIRKEAEDLYDKAQLFSMQKTMRKAQ